ncbi:D-alanyl-D-alanine carboxypeptidase family protein [Kurthia zopfii]|uniref:D-alanyl-D-alanine carboxypeptidase family protein n=1 Tax=Kurthia zopfii TaxID=1650 RepID=UPI000F6E80CE|nr:D-alanyl-D-alanine carboxypeptidase [Kurthia zopfii]VEI08614.1 D-alanyl-D-alanine carboxypeptidase dacB precursor [Kurthia zopfii]
MKKWIYLIVGLVILAGASIAAVQLIENDRSEISQQEHNKGINKPKAKKEKTAIEKDEPIKDQNTSNMKIKSEEALLIDLSSEKVLFAKNADQKAYPASLTKLMTVLVGVEENKNIHSIAEVPAAIFPYLTSANASMAGFSPNEKVTIEDLLNGAMLPSGGDASLALALHTAKNKKEFVKLMNEKAKALGMTNTNFKNVEGLHEKGHYTTAHDLMKLMTYGMKIPAFKKVITAQKYYVKPTNMHPSGLTLNSSLFTKLDMNKKRGYTLLGGKTGYTPESGLSLVSIAKKNGKLYVAITMNAPGTNRTTQYNVLDSLDLYKSIK